MNGMRRVELRGLCLADSRQNCRGGNERMEDWIIFFAWGGSTMCHPPVLLIEDDCAV